jgi:hypothetical protein
MDTFLSVQRLQQVFKLVFYKLISTKIFPNNNSEKYLKPLLRQMLLFVVVESVKDCPKICAT